MSLADWGKEKGGSHCSGFLKPPHPPPVWGVRLPDDSAGPVSLESGILAGNCPCCNSHTQPPPEKLTHYSTCFLILYLYTAILTDISVYVPLETNTAKNTPTPYLISLFSVGPLFWLYSSEDWKLLSEWSDLWPWAMGGPERTGSVWETGRNRPSPSSKVSVLWCSGISFSLRDLSVSQLKEELNLMISGLLFIHWWSATVVIRKVDTDTPGPLIPEHSFI